MTKISAVIITLNEEENIRRCLNSLHGVVEEVVVVDSFSTDNTPNLCKLNKNTRFFQRKWAGYAKNQKLGPMSKLPIPIFYPSTLMKLWMRS